jgi:hypothetical protein
MKLLEWREKNFTTWRRDEPEWWPSVGWRRLPGNQEQRRGRAVQSAISGAMEENRSKPAG